MVSKLEQPRDLSGVAEVNRLGRGFLRQAGHRHNIARQHHDKTSPGRDLDVANWYVKAMRPPFEPGIGRERVLGLGDADGQVAVAFVLQPPELAPQQLVAHDVVGAVDRLGDGADLVPQPHVVGIEQLKVALRVFGYLHHGAGEVFGTCAAEGVVMRGDDFDAEVGALVADALDFGVGVGGKGVDRDDDG